MADFRLETDAALADRLGDLLYDAHPGAELREEGPIRESIGPEEVVNLSYAGSMAVFTVMGGLPPTIEAIKAIIAFVKVARRYPKVGETELVYVAKDGRGGEVRVNLTTANDEVAIAAFKEIFGELRNARLPRRRT